MSKRNLSQILLTISLLLATLLIVALTFTAIPQRTGAAPAQSSLSCPSGDAKLYKGAVPANPIGWQTYQSTEGGHKQGDIIPRSSSVLLTPEIARNLAASCSEVVRLDLITKPFYTRDSNGLLHLNDPSHMFYRQYDEILRNLSQAYHEAHQPLPEVIGLMGPEFLPSQYGYDNGDALKEAQQNHGTGGDNAYIRAFAAQAEGVVRHFQNCTHDPSGYSDPAGCAGVVISHWEVWNEPNNTSTSIYPDNFAALLSRVYTRLKLEGKQGIDPERVRIISGAVFGFDEYPQQGQVVRCSNFEHSGAQYLKETYEAGLNLHDDMHGLLNWKSIQNDPHNTGGYPLDDVGQHIYVDQSTSNMPTLSCDSNQKRLDPYGTPASVRADVNNYLQDVHDVYTRQFPDSKNTHRHTVITEIGWRTVPSGVTAQQQHDFLLIAFNVIKTHSYVATTIWFHLQDQAGYEWGLLDANANPKPSWSAFQQV